MVIVFICQNLIHDRLIISLPNELINIFSKFQENLENSWWSVKQWHTLSSTLSKVIKLLCRHAKNPSSCYYQLQAHLYLYRLNIYLGPLSKFLLRNKKSSIWSTTKYNILTYDHLLNVKYDDRNRCMLIILEKKFSNFFGKNS